MSAFVIFLKVLATTVMFAGSVHLFLGLRGDVLLGAQLTMDTITDPVLDSQNRFYGVVFMGYGALLLLCASAVQKYAKVLRLLLGFIFLGGVARMVSIALYGMPAPPVLGLIATELIGVPLLLWWHAAVLRSGKRAVS